MAASEESVVLGIIGMGSQWQTLDPFLFCAHHRDHYPAGTAQSGISESLSGRAVGGDFSNKDGWSMYHGSTVPGFPQHPHRGFETVTYARRGLIDHADSLGATARFGGGDVQWMTAGAGVVHSEMFPLVNTANDNPLELFQVWLNLPAADKLVDPYFTMLWDENIPTVELDGGGQVTVIAGHFDNVTAPKPPPNSWASRPEADVAIWHITLPKAASWTVPAAHADTNRVLYLFEGSGLSFDNQSFDEGTGIQVRPEVPLEIEATSGPVEVLVLQGKPMGETVAQHGPFVMNTHEEIRQAFDDFNRTQFGGWPWASEGPVHAQSDGRFAIHADGRREDAPT